MIDINEYYLKQKLRKEQKYEESLPVCECCGERIDAEEWMFTIDGEKICLECLKDLCGERVEV